MTLDALIAQTTSRQEIADLLERYSVALGDASLLAQSVDGRYVDAYSAAFLLSKIAIRAARYRVKGGDNHRDIQRVAVVCRLGCPAKRGCV